MTGYMTEEEKKELDIYEQMSSLEKEKMFLRKQNPPTLGEKIDYIYKTLKAQQRNARIKLMIKILLFMYALYFLIFYIPNLPQKIVDDFKKELGDNISSLVTPLVKDVVKDVGNDPGTTDSINSPEMQETLNKAIEKLKEK